MSSPLWDSNEIAHAVGGEARGGDFIARGVSIDTRTLEPGDLFIALAGERDGHEFLDTARTRGAAGALVSRETGGPRVVVADTFDGLQAMALSARERAPHARRCAVTGSVGKTSVTQAIASGLALAGRAHSSVKSYNNHIGVPLTLARMPRETERAVFEVGMNHADEITPLSRMIQPHVVAITTVGPVHIENFADGEAGVAKAKAEVFAGMRPGAVAVRGQPLVRIPARRGRAVEAGGSRLRVSRGMRRPADRLHRRRRRGGRGDDRRQSVALSHSIVREPLGPEQPMRAYIA